MVYKNQNYMTNKKIKEEVDKNQKGYEEETPGSTTPSTPETPNQNDVQTPSENENTNPQNPDNIEPTE